MKPAIVKYNEAITRNLRTFLDSASAAMSNAELYRDKITSLAGMTIESARTKIGLKKDDGSKDTAISAVLKQAEDIFKNMAAKKKKLAKEETAEAKKEQVATEEKPAKPTSAKREKTGKGKKK